MTRASRDAARRPRPVPIAGTPPFSGHCWNIGSHSSRDSPPAGGEEEPDLRARLAVICTLGRHGEAPGRLGEEPVAGSSDGDGKAGGVGKQEEEMSRKKRWKSVTQHSGNDCYLNDSYSYHCHTQVFA